MLATTPGQRVVADVRMFLLGALLFSKEMMVVLAIEPSMATYGLERVRKRPAAEVWAVTEPSMTQVAA